MSDVIEEETTDTGELLEVPEEDRLDEDDYVEAEVNEDEGQTEFGSDDGNYVTLSTADLDDEDED